MKHVRLGAAALNQTPLAWDMNRRHIVAALDAAREAGIGILCLPELCISGYGCEDMFLSAGVRATAHELLAELLPETEGLLTVLGVPLCFDDAVYNTAAVVCDGRLLGFVAKQILAGDGIHYEPRWFRPWPAGVVVDFEFAGGRIPLGDLLFDCGGVRVGLEICRDAWLPERPCPRLAARGAHLILNPSASHFAFGKQDIRRGFVTEAARDYGLAYAYANLLGNESGRSIYDGGTLLAAGGEIVISGPRFSFADMVLTSATVALDVDANQPHNRPPARDVSSLVVHDFDYPPAQDTEPASSTWLVEEEDHWRPSAVPVDTPPGHPDWETGGQLKREEFSRAVPLGLFDYLRKSRTKGFVVSLSGGADSASVALMVHLMADLAGRELGWQRVSARLDRQDDAFADSAAAVVNQLLACVYQSTVNSSKTTRRAAQTVAETIGAEFYHWSIDEQVDAHVYEVSQALGHTFNWKYDDLALQNIQARVRGPGAWLLANLRGAILLATSNRSEAAVGYATMDGDTCGGLAPLAGIDKAFLRDWLSWMETVGPAGLAPIPALEVVTSQSPTAELRPPDAGQTDEDDLMPYRVLDAIERAAIRDRQMPLDVLMAVAPLFPEHGMRQMGMWVERFFVLWCRNQWKRERYAPSFHLDDQNLDPKSWCRFPILSGGFDRELERLRSHLENIVE